MEPAAFRAFLPDWQPLFWELAQHSTDQLLHSRDALFQALALLRVEDQEQPEAERACRGALLQLGGLHDTNFVRWQDLIKFILGWAYHRRPPEELSNWTALAEQLQADEQRKRELNAMKTTAADVLRFEGRVEGRVEGARSMLLRQGRKKFGEPETPTLQKLLSITDVDHLERLSDALLDAKSWQELISVA